MSEHTCAIVGAKFRPPAPAILATLPAGFPLSVRREPSNVHDANAIAVWLDARDTWSELDSAALDERLAGYGMTSDDIVARMPLQLGYIPREEAANIAPAMDAAGIVAQHGVFAFSREGHGRITFVIASRAD